MLKSTAARIAICTAAIAAVPMVASAKDRDDHFRRDDDHRAEYRHDDRGHEDRDHDKRGGIEVQLGTEVIRSEPRVETSRVWVEPVYQNQTTRVWVPATYRTVVDHKSVEPVTRTETERVWVPDRYETKKVKVLTPNNWYYKDEKVLVEKGHYEDCPHEVVVVPGHYEDCPRQELVCDGYYEDQVTQVLVTPGHWEDCNTVAVAPHEDNHARINLRIPF